MQELEKMEKLIKEFYKETQEFIKKMKEKELKYGNKRNE